MTNDDLTQLFRNPVMKEVIKEAITEWLDKQVNRFGYWSAKILLAGAAAGALYLMLIANGWRRP